jgi:hypothetical protein
MMRQHFPACSPARVECNAAVEWRRRWRRALQCDASAGVPDGPSSSHVVRNLQFHHSNLSFAPLPLCKRDSQN